MWSPPRTCCEPAGSSWSARRPTSCSGSPPCATGARSGASPASPPARPAVGPLALVPNPDVLATLAATGRVRCPVGFALESLDERAGGFAGAVDRARAKLARKGLRALVLNGLEAMEAGTSEAWWIVAGREPEPLGTAAKQELARSIVDHVEATCGLARDG
ncbi:MAG: phosphopantothenoylcysteine decarboxylase [Planctomycetota bacterium]